MDDGYYQEDHPIWTTDIRSVDRNTGLSQGVYTILSYIVAVVLLNADGTNILGEADPHLVLVYDRKLLDSDSFLVDTRELKRAAKINMESPFSGKAAQ